MHDQRLDLLCAKGEERVRKGEGEGCVRKEINLDKVKGVPISNGPRGKRLHEFYIIIALFPDKLLRRDSRFFFDFYPRKGYSVTIFLFVLFGTHPRSVNSVSLRHHCRNKSPIRGCFLLLADLI